MEISEFYAARLDEDEMRRGIVHSMACRSLSGGPCGCGEPERRLREVEAGRAILAEHRTRVMLVPGLRGDVPQYWCETCHVPGDYPGSNWCATLRHMVAVYSNHPDYQESWKP